jgi:hypothetical protein
MAARGSALCHYDPFGCNCFFWIQMHPRQGRTRTRRILLVKRLPRTAMMGGRSATDRDTAILVQKVQKLITTY